MKNQKSKNLKHCRYCINQIEENASVCHYCGRNQNKLIYYIEQFSSPTALIMVLLAIVQLVFAHSQMNEARKERIKASDALKLSQKANFLADSSLKETVKITNRIKESAVEFDSFLISIRNEIIAFSDIEVAAMKMRSGIRSGLDELIEIQKTSTNKIVKERAKFLFDDIAQYYELTWNVKDAGGISKIIKCLSNYTDSKINDNDELIPKLIEFIEFEKRLSFLTLSFHLLRDKTGITFKMFDIDSVCNWYNLNYLKNRR